MKQIRPRLTYANVMSSIAVFLMLGGGAAVAANQLGKNAVGAKQLKKNAVTAAKIKKNAVTTAKLKKNAVTTAKIRKDAVTGAKVNESTLGTVPSAALANALAPPEPVRLVGAPGQPPFESGSFNFPAEGPFSFNPVGFWKDHEGVVHLQGAAVVGEFGPPFVFTLPPGYRPAPGRAVPVNLGSPEFGAIIFGSNTSLEGIVLDGKVLVPAGEAVILDGITFRAES